MGPMNLADFLRATAADHGPKPALVPEEGDPWTFAHLDAEADRVAAGLAARGIVPGDRVVLVFPNRPEFAAAYFGTLRAGAVAAPVNPMLTAAEIEPIVRDAEPRLVLADDDLGQIRPVWPDVVGLGDLIPAGPVTSYDAASDDLAVLAYTSGTSASPKGVMLTHGNLGANLDQQLAVPGAEITPDDVLLLTLPLSHIFGLNVALGLVARTGATGILVERFQPVRVLELIPQQGITVVFGPPTLYLALADTPGADQYDLSSVRLAVSGAAPLPSTVLERFQMLFGVDIWEGYGLTETAPTLTWNRVAPQPRAGSIGKPLPDVELRLVDEEDHDVDLGDPGEIIVRGPNVFSGYWRRPDETAAALRDGWFRTGDVAIRDEEGYLYLVDRKRELILVSGFNVYPAEVEDALQANPKVAEAAVVGVPHATTGEAVKAYVVLAEGQSASPQELLEDVSTRLARFKRPKSIDVVDSLPHVPTGKVLKRALRT